MVKIDKAFRDLMRADTPEFNPILKKGIAVIQLKRVEERIDAIFRMLEKEFPEGLRYVGCRRCTYQEEYRETTRIQNGSSTFDITESYLYLMRYDFTYKDRPIDPKYVYLPYVDENGLMYISDTLYQVVPVLADRRVTVDKDNVFIHPLRAKITVKRLTYAIAINGQMNQLARIPHSKLYHTSSEQNNLERPVKMECVLLHYILCRHGFKGAFQKYLGIDPIVGHSSEITADRYPPDQWTIYSSNYYGTEWVPDGVSKFNYTPSSLRVAVPKALVTDTVKSYMAAFFYIVDRFPDRILPEYLTQDPDSEKDHWIILLGSAVLSSNLHPGRLLIDFRDHIYSLDRYVDTISREYFKRIGIEVDDLYDLFDLVIREVDQWILEGKRNLSSIYNKELNVIDFILNPLVEQMVTMMFKLVSDGKKELPKRTDEEEAIKLIEKTMKILKKGVLYRLTGESGAVVAMNNPGDNKAFKTIMTRQIKSKKTARRNKNEEAILKSEAHQFHVSLMEGTGHTNVTKTDPSGRERYNMCANLSDDYMILPHPDMKDALQATQIAMYPHFRHHMSLDLDSSDAYDDEDL